MVGTPKANLKSGKVKVENEQYLYIMREVHSVNGAWIYDSMLSEIWP